MCDPRTTTVDSQLPRQSVAQQLSLCPTQATGLSHVTDSLHLAKTRLQFSEEIRTWLLGACHDVKTKASRQMAGRSIALVETWEGCRNTARAGVCCSINRSAMTRARTPEVGSVRVGDNKLTTFKLVLSHFFTQGQSRRSQLWWRSGLVFGFGARMELVSQDGREGK